MTAIWHTIVKERRTVLCSDLQACNNTLTNKSFTGSPVLTSQAAEDKREVHFIRRLLSNLRKCVCNYSLVLLCIYATPPPTSHSKHCVVYRFTLRCMPKNAMRIYSAESYFTGICPYIIASIYHCIMNNKYSLPHYNAVFCTGVQKGWVPSEKGTFSAVNGWSKGHN